MTRTLVIAECGSSWDCDESKAFRLIEAAKACDADIAKFQWTSNAKAMAERRLGPNAVGPTQMYKRYLEYPLETLMRLKAHCDSVGIEFLVTAYLIEDIATIAPLVKRFKVSAFEAKWREFIEAHIPFRKDLIISMNPRAAIDPHTFDQWMNYTCKYSVLHCVSKYPTPVEELGLINCRVLDEGPNLDGLSDHTTSTLTGALAVAAGATIVEKHIRLFDTSQDCPDYPHSLLADGGIVYGLQTPFAEYVSNIREAERCM